MKRNRYIESYSCEDSDHRNVLEKCKIKVAWGFLWRHKLGRYTELHRKEIFNAEVLTVQ